MIGLLTAAREKGEAALKRASWSLAGAGLVVVGLGFAAGAVVAALETVAPAYVAYGVAAAGLVAAALFCFAQAQAPAETGAARAAGSLDGDLGGAQLAPHGGDWKSFLNEALAREARDKPARAAAIAAIAGLILGAIEGLDEKKPDL